MKNAAIAVVALLLMQPPASFAELPRACFTPQMRAEFWSRMHALLDLPAGRAPVERQVLDNIDRARADYDARALEKRSPRWHEFLPTCPRVEPRGSRAWQVERGTLVDCFHAGAAACYRSAESYSSARADGHQQQCCYDGGGQLMTAGAHPLAAGTPDYAGTIVPIPDLGPMHPRQQAAAAQQQQLIRLSAAANHARIDVLPWLAFDGDAGRYHRYWPPNAGPIRVGGSATGSIAMLANDVVLLELEPGTARVRASLVAEGLDAAPLALPDRACVVARRAGTLTLAPPADGGEAFVSWRRLIASSQCRVAVLSIPGGP